MLQTSPVENLLISTELTERDLRNTSVTIAALTLRPTLLTCENG